MTRYHNICTLLDIPSKHEFEECEPEEGAQGDEDIPESDHEGNAEEAY